jgi:hypothetical protein
MEVNRTASNIVHTKYLDRNRNFIARQLYLTVRSRGETGQSYRDPTEMESLGSTVLAIDGKTRLPIFPKFGKSELRVKPFMKARLITLLRSELWHHLIENRELLTTLVSPQLPIAASISFRRGADAGFNQHRSFLGIRKLPYQS